MLTPLEQWDRAWSLQEAYYDWKEANPDADLAACVDQREAIGAKFTGPGSASRTNGVFRVHLEGHEPHWLVQCVCCTSLFQTDNWNQSTCSTDCAGVVTKAKAEAKASKRKKRRAALSEALAERTGCCLQCGNEFPLKRTTGKTCSDACRKALGRRSEPVPIELPALLPEDGFQALLDAYDKAAATDFKSPHAALAALRKADEALMVEVRKRRLHALAVSAPALLLWILKQPADDVREILDLESEASRRVLGEALRSKLRRSR